MHSCWLLGMHGLVSTEYVLIVRLRNDAEWIGTEAGRMASILSTVFTRRYLAAESFFFFACPNRTINQTTQTELDSVWEWTHFFVPKKLGSINVKVNSVTRVMNEKRCSFIAANFVCVDMRCVYGARSTRPNQILSSPQPLFSRFEVSITMWTKATMWAKFIQRTHPVIPVKSWNNQKHTINIRPSDGWVPPQPQP